MSITSVILRKTFQWEGGGGGMILRREIPSPSIFEKGKKNFQSKIKTSFECLEKKYNNITENSLSIGLTHITLKCDFFILIIISCFRDSINFDGSKFYIAITCLVLSYRSKVIIKYSDTNNL